MYDYTVALLVCCGIFFSIEEIMTIETSSTFQRSSFPVINLDFTTSR
jgi:hypothetical protein